MSASKKVPRGAAPLVGLPSGALQMLTRPGPITNLVSLFERRSYREAELVSDGLRLHYEVHGTGEQVVVLLHGIL
ncbi:MAG TPA: hypothetical protein VE991_02225, partial [Acidimicrobiales bacterium]|nr:hypothetical protein [Acidimicrobiales bacterium]